MPAKNTDSTHVDLRQRARPVAHHGAREPHQPVGDAAHAHQVRGQEEERHRQQDERVVGFEGLVERAPSAKAAARGAASGRQASAERESHRHAQHEQEEEQAEQHERRHAGRQSGLPVMRRAADQDAHIVEDLLRRGTAARSTPASGQATKMYHHAAGRRARKSGPSRSRTKSMPPTDEHQREHQDAKTCETMRNAAFAARGRVQATRRPRNGPLARRRSSRRS